MKPINTTRLVSAMSAAALAVTAFGYLPRPTTANAAALTGKDAKGIVSEMTIGWNLGNSLDSTDKSLKSTAAPEKFAKAWGNPVPTAEQFQAVKDAGFNTVRIPTTWFQHLEWDEDSQMYLVNDTWMGFVKQTVDYAIDRDMFVILNVHHEDWVNVDVFTDDTYKEAEKKLTDIWTQVAEEFKDYDQHLIFEGLNEPRQTGNPDVNQWGDGTDDGGYTTKYINDLNATFVKTVRANKSAANQERLLMLPGYCASNQKKAVSNIEIPDGAGNVALSVHAYTPYYFTMATDEYANHEFPGKSGWGADYESELTNMFDYLGQISEEKGVPIIIGEFSASDFSNTEARCAWATDYLTKAKAKGIPCVLWDNNVVGRTDGEAHGYLYRKGCTWYDESAKVIEAMMAVYGITPKLPEYVEITEPKFDWSLVNILDEWKEMYKKETGKTLKDWDNVAVRGWKDYVVFYNDYDLIYASSSAPELVFQDAAGDYWIRVPAYRYDESTFTATFTYNDIVTTLAEAGLTLDDVDNMYISATTESMTVYGLYAYQALNGDPPAPSETTEEPSFETEETTETTLPTDTTNQDITDGSWIKAEYTGIISSISGSNLILKDAVDELTGDKCEKVIFPPNGISEEDAAKLEGFKVGDQVRLKYEVFSGSGQIRNFTLTLIPPAASATREVKFDYADLEDGEEGKIIPIEDIDSLEKIIIGVKSECDAAWYCGGGALCANNILEEDGSKTWGFAEFQWNKDDTTCTVDFGGEYKKPGETEEDEAIAIKNAVLTENTLEMRHWWTASADEEDGSDITYEYLTVTVVYADTASTETTESVITPGAVVYGDVTGDNAVDILDVIALNKFLLGSETLTADQKTAADVDLNDEIDSTDSLNILKYVVEMVSALPVK